VRAAADPPTVLNHLGRGAAEQIVAALPDARVVSVPGHGSLPDDVEGEVLLTLPWGTLDVADPEPLPAGHPLYAHPGVRLSPHVSWAAPGALDRLVASFVGNLRAYVADEPPAGLVDRVAGY
jgi:hypothetical protein